MSLGYVLDRLATATGGRYDVVLSPMALDDALAQALGRRARQLPPGVRHRSGPQEAQAADRRRAARDEGAGSGRVGAGAVTRDLANGITKMKRRQLALTALGLAVALASGPAPARAQVRQPPTFGTGIEIINLSLSVTDTQSNYVTDLGQKDFAVFEDGIRQELSLFTHENLPISMVVMIDCSGSMDQPPAKLTTAQSAAIRFIKTLRPQDLAQVVQFNDRATTLQAFTSDHAALEAAIRKTEASGSTALHNALYIALKDLMKDKKAAELRRRAVVLLSDGEDTASLVSDEQVLELARKSEINIYAISLRKNRAEGPQPPGLQPGRRTCSRPSRATPAAAAYFPTSLSELDCVYDRIAEELRTLYSVGYVSSNPRRDGKWRRIVVRVPDREGMTIRHKIGYYAPAS